MPEFVSIIRIIFLSAVFCRGAFADTQTDSFSPASEPHASNKTAVLRRPENKLADPVSLNFNILVPKQTYLGESALSSLNSTESKAPDIQLVPERNSGNIIPPKLGSLMSGYTNYGESSSASPEPFNLPAMTASRGDVPARWAELQSRILVDENTLAACDMLNASCPKAAQHLLSIVALGRERQGFAQLGWINRAVNLSIKPMSDWAQYGYAQYWASPLQTLSSGAGDCKDYTVVKYAALRKLGFAPDDLRLVIVRDNARLTEHEILAVRYEQKWVILDNLTMAMRDTDQVPHYYPLFVMDYRGVRAFTTALARR